MIKIKTLLATIAIAIAGSTVAYAGPYSDRLGQCLVEKTTSQDRLVLVQWVFSALAAHPSLDGMSSLTAAQLRSFDEGTAGLFTRLMTEDCVTEMRNALNYEGEAAMQASFQLLGQVAFADLLQAPRVTQRMESMSQYLDESKFQQALGR